MILKRTITIPDPDLEPVRWERKIVHAIYLFAIWAALTFGGWVAIHDMAPDLFTPKPAQLRINP